MNELNKTRFVTNKVVPDAKLQQILKIPPSGFGKLGFDWEASLPQSSEPIAAQIARLANELNETRFATNTQISCAKLQQIPPRGFSSLGTHAGQGRV